MHLKISSMVGENFEIINPQIAKNVFKKLNLHFHTEKSE